MSPVAVSLILFIGTIAGVSLAYCVQCGVQRNAASVRLRRVQ
jgi:hypothetical protein